MALVLDDTAGGASANTYITLADAETYFEGRANKASWTAASDADKNIALVHSTRLLDAMFMWAMNPTTDTQALQWPRNGILDTNRLRVIPDTEIPDEVKWATCEWAMGLIAGDLTADSGVAAQSLTALKAGPVELKFQQPVFAKACPDSVVNLIPSWWGYLDAYGSGFNTVPLERA